MATAYQQLEQAINKFGPGGEIAGRGRKLSEQLQRQLQEAGIRSQAVAGLPVMGGGEQYKPVSEQFGRELESGRVSGLIQALMSKAGYLRSKEDLERQLDPQKRAQSEIDRKLQQLGNTTGVGGGDILRKQLMSELTGMTFTGQAAPNVPVPAPPAGGYTLQPDYEQVAAKQRVYAGRSIPDIQF